MTTTTTIVSCNHPYDEANEKQKEVTLRETCAEHNIGNREIIENLISANRYLKSKGKPPLIDLDYLYKLAKLQSNPAEYDTSLEPAPAGYEYVVDITGREPTKLVPIDDAARAEIEANLSNKISSESEGE